MSLYNNQNVPWLVGGDFYSMLVSSEKKGGGNFKMHETDIFQEAVSTCSLEDLGFIGHEFTWSNNRGGEENIQERLDRFLANDLQKRPLRVGKERRKNKMFRFEEMWLREDSSETVINNA
ncbi:Hydroxyacylglutathione hydrolase [Bienertia sinuspersici]